MNLIELRKRQSFLTKRKEEYNLHLKRYIERVFRFFDLKTDILPPTIDYIFEKPWSVQLDTIEPILNLKLNEISPEDKIKFSEDLIIQEEILRIVKKRNEKFNYRCWLIKTNTWGGKSHVIMDIANYYQTNTLILVHNLKTMWEMFQKFVKFSNITPAQYWWWKAELWNITIMTKERFSKCQSKIDFNFKLVLIDEAPIYFSKDFWNWLNAFFDWKKWIALYWLSATPFTLDLDESDLERYFWKLIMVKKKDKNWYNFIPDFTFYDYIVDKWIYEYENPAEMRTAVSENEDRYNEQEEKIIKLFDKRKCLLILTDRKSEAERFAKSKKFWWIFQITWDTQIEDDDKNIKSAEKLVKAWKRVCIIWTIQKVKAWVDIPFIDTIFLWSAIKFWANVIQAVWRWLRLYEYKNDVKVWIWNDLPHYKQQKAEKFKVVENEYLLKRDDIEIVKILRKRKKNINN